MSYINPIPILIDSKDEGWFYEPITRNLNKLTDEGIIVGGGYFQPEIKVQDLHLFIECFNKIGVNFNNEVNAKLTNKFIKIETRPAFTICVEALRKNFLNTLKSNNLHPEYLKGAEKEIYCTECISQTCKDNKPYCVRAYVEDIIETYKEE